MGVRPGQPMFEQREPFSIDQRDAHPQAASPIAVVGAPERDQTRALIGRSAAREDQLRGSDLGTNGRHAGRDQGTGRG